MTSQQKNYALYCASTIMAGAALGMICFFASDRLHAKDAIVSFDLGCIREHGMTADCEVADNGHSVYRDFSKAAAKFQAAPMPRFRASLRRSPLPSPAMKPMMMMKNQKKLLEGFGDSPMKAVALAAFASGKSGAGRTSELKMAVESLDATEKGKLEKMEEDVLTIAKNMPGVTQPLGFFDPSGFCSDEEAWGTTVGKLCFYREVELKHGRVAMLAALGFVVGEQWHPLFGGDIDVPSYIAFQASPLQQFWPSVVAAIAIPEFISAATFEPLSVGGEEGEKWSMPTDRVPGDFKFDPLGLKPKDPEKLKVMQTKELNNGRLAMIAAAGMVAQELATGQKLF
jgi:hypothetical protein